MTVPYAHARNACAHEQSTNIESGAVQWHKQSEQLWDCLCECEREKVYCIDIASRTYCHPELVEGSRGNETSLYVCHFTSFRSREIATLTLAMTIGDLSQRLAERATPSRQSAELWHEHLSVYGLIAKIFCAVSNAISQVWLWSVRGTRIDVATQRAERATPSRQSAELWHEHLSVYGLIAKIFCAVSNAISQVWLTLLRQTRIIVATTMTFA